MYYNRSSPRSTPWASEREANHNRLQAGLNLSAGLGNCWPTLPRKAVQPGIFVPNICQYPVSYQAYQIIPISCLTMTFPFPVWKGWHLLMDQPWQEEACAVNFQATYFLASSGPNLPWCKYTVAASSLAAIVAKNECHRWNNSNWSNHL